MAYRMEQRGRVGDAGPLYRCCRCEIRKYALWIASIKPLSSMCELPVAASVTCHLAGSGRRRVRHDAGACEG